MNNWLVVSVLRLTDWLCLLMAAPPLCAAMMWLFSLGSWQNGTFFFSPSLKTHIHTHKAKDAAGHKTDPITERTTSFISVPPRGLDTCRTACMSDALEPAAFRLFSPPAFLYGFCDGMCSRTHAQKICTFVKKGKREIFFLSFWVIIFFLLLFRMVIFFAQFLQFLFQASLKDWTSWCAHLYVDFLTYNLLNCSTKQAGQNYRHKMYYLFDWRSSIINQLQTCPKSSVNITSSVCLCTSFVVSGFTWFLSIFVFCYFFLCRGCNWVSVQCWNMFVCSLGFCVKDCSTLCSKSSSM